MGKKGRPQKRNTPISCLFISDVHYGQLNELFDNISFNPDICEKMFDTIINDLKTHKKETDEEIYLFLLGDIIEGNSNYKSQISESINVTAQMKGAVAILVGFIFDLMSMYSKIKVIGVVGNHGRIDSRRDLTKENWDRMIYDQLRLAFVNQKTVDIIVCDDFIQRVKVDDRIFIVSHGDHTRSWSGIPFYALRRDSAKFFMDLGKFDTMVMGHFHCFADMYFNGIHLIMNGCFPPANPFSKRVIKSKPTQIQTFLKVLGKDIIETRKIWLHQEQEESELLQL